MTDKDCEDYRDGIIPLYEVVPRTADDLPEHRPSLEDSLASEQPDEFSSRFDPQPEHIGH